MRDNLPVNALVVAALVTLSVPGPAAIAGGPQGKPAGSATLKAASGGDLQYRYERGGVSFELRSRERAFTAAEAVMVRDSLDSLPVAYLKKAWQGGARKLYRDDATPVRPWTFLTGENGADACAVPPAPWSYIALGDGVFTSADDCYRILVHELGHAVQWNEAGYATVTGTPFTPISWVGNAEPVMGVKSHNGFVTDYARTNHREDFAESCLYYWLAPEELYRVNPAKYQYMRTKCFGGEVSPASARRKLKAIAPVAPAIGSLGATGGELGDLVAVKGGNFMGPLDGGFNKVRFGGKATVHLPASRGLVYAFVPDLPQGEAPVRVTTQDGASHQAAFSVEGEPWWKFW